MRWNHGGDLPTRAEIARRIHSEWLTWALSADDRFPRIPRQAVTDGGFEALLARPKGRRVCERWWRRAFVLLDRITPQELRG